MYIYIYIYMYIYICMYIYIYMKFTYTQYLKSRVEEFQDFLLQETYSERLPAGFGPHQNARLKDLVCGPSSNHGMVILGRTLEPAAPSAGLCLLQPLARPGQ